MRPPVEHLRVRHLCLLELLVQHGTVRKAAERLHASQAAASQMLAELESAFGGPLFTRTRSGVQPTSRLVDVLPRIKIVLGELEAACGQIATVSQPVIRIGANLQFLTQLLPPAIAQLHNSDPGTRFLLQEGPSDSLIRALMEGSLDCAIARLSTRALRDSKCDKDLQFWPLGGGQLCLVVGCSHPLAKRKRIAIEDLIEEQWALGIRSGQGREIMERVFLEAGLRPPQPMIECRPQFANLAFAAQIPLIAVATRVDALAWQEAGLLHVLPIDISEKISPIAFVCRKATANNKWLVQLREIVGDVARDIETGTHNGSIPASRPMKADSY